MLRGSGVTQGRGTRSSQQSARTNSFDAVESFESPCEVADLAKRGSVTQQRVTRTAAVTRLPEVASRFQPGMDEIYHERSGTLGNAISIYLRRWEIETLFSCLKARGVNVEDTRMTDLQRIEKLMAVVAMATAWVHRIGEWRAEIKPIKFKR